MLELNCKNDASLINYPLLKLWDRYVMDDHDRTIHPTDAPDFVWIGVSNKTLSDPNDRISDQRSTPASALSSASATAMGIKVNSSPSTAHSSLSACSSFLLISSCLTPFGC